MASQLAQSQLSRQISINAAGIAASPPVAVPAVMQNPPPQTPFPQYMVGYNVDAGVEEVLQTIPPRPTGGQTSTHPFDMLAANNLHPILFQLEPPPTLTDVKVPTLVDQATGEIETGRNGRPLRYFSHIPRWISVDVSGMLMELWLHLDPRVEMSDILGRLNVDKDEKVPGANTFNMRRLRFRLTINALSSSGRQYPTRNDVDLLEDYTTEQILLNTCMVVDLVNNRLLKPILVNITQVLGYIDSGLAVDYFISGFPTPLPIPSDYQVLTLELRKRMQTLAMRRGLGNAPQDYGKVPRDLQPSWWQKGLEAKEITDLDGKTHSEWVDGLAAQLSGGPKKPRRTRRAAAARSTGQTPGAQRAQAQPQPPPPPPSQRPLQPRPPQLQPQPQQSALFPRPGQADAAGGATVVRPAAVRQTPVEEEVEVDPRLLVANTTALVAPVPPVHVRHAGGVSYYVEATHVAGYVAADAQSQLEVEAEAGTGGAPGGGEEDREVEERVLRHLGLLSG